MKRTAAFFLTVLIAVPLLLCGCESKLEKQLKEESEMELGRYNYQTYIATPIWKGDLIAHESLMFIEAEDGSYTASLMYEPERIVCVKDSSLKTEYKEGVDYTVSGKTFTLIASGSMPRLTRSEYYPAVNNGDAIEKVGGGLLKLVGGSYFHEHQIAVTYRHNEKWSGPVPEYKGDLLPKSIAKLKNNEALNLLFYGDSITWGGDSSGLHQVMPNAPIWPMMATQGISKYYSNQKINYVNTAVGGFNSTQGVENMQSKAVDIKPDLCFIGFGMNDATQGTTPDKVCANIETIMNAVLAVSPDCEFVIVATWLPNAEVFYGGGSMLKTHGDQADAFKKFEKTGVAVMNVTEISSYMLTLKSFKDMTGNNVNHPNDFFARIYAEIAMKTLCKDY